MYDSARVIENLIYTYAELIDAGNIDGVAELFRHGRIHGVEGGGPETVFEGVEAVRALYRSTVRLHEDGTPRTKHLTTNARIEVDADDTTARARTNYLVFQATDKVPLQPIVAGHYVDTFHRVDGAWAFETRTMYLDLIGDLSDHLTW